MLYATSCTGEVRLGRNFSDWIRGVALIGMEPGPIPKHFEIIIEAWK